MSKRPGDSRRKLHRRQPAGRRARLESLESRQLFSAGSLDTSFGGTGIVEAVVPGGVVYEATVAVLPSQKIVTVGTAYVPIESDGAEAEIEPEIELARYNTDGTLDTSFGISGKTDTSVAHVDLVTQAAIAPDGKIVVVGRSANAGYGGFIARFDADGTLDQSFGNGGFATLSGGGGADADSDLPALSIQPDGKIVTGMIGQPSEFTLERFDSDGTPDASFGQAGILQLTNSVAEFGGVAIALNGDVLVSGGNSAGQVVLEFDTTGKQVASLETLILQNDEANSLLVDGDGDIVVSGTAATSSPQQSFPYVLRLTPDLKLDPSFGQAGVALLAQAGLQSDLAEEPDGKYALEFAASTSPSQPFQTTPALARLNQDGSLDTSFGTDGLETGVLANDSDSIAVQADGNLLLVATSTTDFFDGVGIVARFLGNPGAVNQAPSFTKGADQSLPQDSGPQSLTNWATAISQGAGDEGQTLNFVVQATNASLFAVPPAISPTGTLTYTPATGVSGAALVTVTLHDSGGTAGGGSDTSAAQTFIINVGPFSPWQNPISIDDVDANGTVSPLDALIIINEINANGAHTLGALANPPSGPVDYLDVNGDGVVSPLDALIIINDLNAETRAGGTTLATSSPAASVSPPNAAAVPIVTTAAAIALQASALVESAPIVANNVSAATASLSSAQAAAPQPAVPLAASQAIVSRNAGARPRGSSAPHSGSDDGLG
jgi:uncharacterized delta-60 repeat protein